VVLHRGARALFLFVALTALAGCAVANPLKLPEVAHLPRDFPSYPGATLDSQFKNGALVDYSYSTGDSTATVMDYYEKRLKDDPYWVYRAEAGNTIYFESKETALFQATLDVSRKGNRTVMRFTGD
jgi:hypothetical protein